MKLFAISDLHLSGAADKPMDIFGEQWKNHKESIEKNWSNKVQEEDTVLIPGDISWAMRLEEAKVDLDFLANLPGRKIFIKGNHDYWWNSTGKLNGLYENMVFVQNTCASFKDFAICGTRGWDLPGEKFTLEDAKIYQREQGRMKLSLETAVKKGYDKIIWMMHFPPILHGMEDNAFMNILKEYPIREVVYGHLHGRDNFQGAVQGKISDCNYRLVSADYIHFDPVLILP